MSSTYLPGRSSPGSTRSRTAWPRPTPAASAASMAWGSQRVPRPPGLGRCRRLRGHLVLLRSWRPPCVSCWSALPSRRCGPRTRARKSPSTRRGRRAGPPCRGGLLSAARREAGRRCCTLADDTARDRAGAGVVRARRTRAPAAEEARLPRRPDPWHRAWARAGGCFDRRGRAAHDLAGAPRRGAARPPDADARPAGRTSLLRLGSARWGSTAPCVVVGVVAEPTVQGLQLRDAARAPRGRRRALPREPGPGRAGAGHRVRGLAARKPAGARRRARDGGAPAVA